MRFVCILATIVMTLISATQELAAAQGPPHRKVFAVAVQGPNRVWFGTERGLALWDGQSFTHMFTEDGLPHDTVTSIAVSRDGSSVWFGTFGGVAQWLERPDQSGARFRTYTQANSGLVNDVVYGIALAGDDGQDVWIATTNGANHFDTVSNRWTTWDDRNAPFHEVWCYDVHVDDEDIVWFGVWGSGVLRYHEGEWTDYVDTDGLFDVNLVRDDGNLHEIVTSVSVANGVLWAGSYFGLSRFDGNRWWTWTVADDDSGLPSDFVNVVHARGDTVWIGTDKGLCSFDFERGRWTTYSSRDGQGEIRVFEDGRWTIHEVPMTLPGIFIWSIDFQDNRIWIGTSSGIGMGEFQ